MFWSSRTRSSGESIKGAFAGGGVFGDGGVFEEEPEGDIPCLGIEGYTIGTGGVRNLALGLCVPRVGHIDEWH